MKPTFRTALFMGLLIVCVSGFLIGGKRPDKPQQPQPSITPVKPETPPSAVLGFDSNAVPGQYYFGNGTAVNCRLILNKDHRFTFSWSGCGSEYDRNRGSWELTGDVVVLKPEMPNKHGGLTGMNLRYIPVKWGHRVYLIDENEVPGFCVMTRNQGPPAVSITHIHGFDYVRVDPSGPVAKGPILPARYLDYYQYGPVKSKVAKIDSAGHVILTGHEPGRWKVGQLLSLDSDVAEVQIVSVSGNTAAAEARYFWNSSRKIKVGDQLSTGGTYGRPPGTGYPRRNNPPRVARK